MAIKKLKVNDTTYELGVDTTYTQGSGINISNNTINLADHSSTATTYGVGTSANYGHLKLSDNYDSLIGSATTSNNGNVAASQLAIYNLYNNSTKLTVSTTDLAEGASLNTGDIYLYCEVE